MKTNKEVILKGQGSVASGRERFSIGEGPWAAPEVLLF